MQCAWCKIAAFTYLSACKISVRLAYSSALSMLLFIFRWCGLWAMKYETMRRRPLKLQLEFVFRDALHRHLVLLWISAIVCSMELLVYCALQNFCQNAANFLASCRVLAKEVWWFVMSTPYISHTASNVYRFSGCLSLKHAKVSIHDSGSTRCGESSPMREIS